MPNWKLKKYSPIGLDWAVASLRAVQLVRQNRSWQLFAAWEVKIPDAPQQNTPAVPEGVAEQTVLTQFKQLINCGGFVGHEVVLHCPAQRLDMRLMEIPAGNEGLPREAIMGALKLKMGGKLTIPAEQAVFDYVPLEHDRDQAVMRLMTVSADGEWIKQRIDLVESAGLHCVGVDALPCALTRLVSDGSSGAGVPGSQRPDFHDLENSDNQGNPHLTAILDMGLMGSTLIVCNCRGPIFCRRFSLGGQKLSEILSQRLLMDIRQAEKLIRTYGLNYQARCVSCGDKSLERFASSSIVEQGVASSAIAEVEGGAEYDTEIAKVIYAALQTELNDYLLALTRSLNYVVTTAGDLRLDKFLLCGGGAHLKNLTDFFSNSFELPVEIISHPLLEEISSRLPTGRAQRGAWATALGLALAGGGN